MCLVIGTGDPKAKNMEAPYPIEFCSSWGSSETRSPVGVSVSMYGLKQIHFIYFTELSHTILESPKSSVQLNRVEAGERLHVSRCFPQAVRKDNVLLSRERHLFS